MISIRQEILDIETGRYSRKDNPLVNAPHSARSLTLSEWTHEYERETAVFPLGL